MFERSARVYDLLYSFKDYEVEARDLVRLIHERNPGATSLLDVACGTGKHLELLRGDFSDVAGVDLNAELLAIAQERLPDVPFTAADMRTFDLGRTFDAVTCMFSSVGYLRDDADLAEAIARMAAHLGPGGVLIVDGWVRPDAWWPGTNVQALAETAGGRARRADLARGRPERPRHAVPDREGRRRIRAGAGTARADALQRRGVSSRVRDGVPRT